MNQKMSENKRMIFKLASQRSVKWLCEVEEETWDLSERQKRGGTVAAAVAVVVNLTLPILTTELYWINR
jgi:hypothetical protein